ncbi:MAG: ABC transporter substrate-binding protein [Trueperaceae bacterium]|nr:MAG: ABC transporter substrate-binding protein [Trueperaceae bacterium]
MKPLTALLTCLLLNLAAATSYPLTITDDLGRQITIESEPSRLVTMLPSHTETLCALGRCDSILGTDTFSTYPASVEALPKLGDLYSPNIEGIIALDPDLVLIGEDDELASALSKAGLTVYAGNAQRYEELLEKITTLGQMVNREEAAGRINLQIRVTVAGLASLLGNSATPSIYYEISNEYYSPGPASFIGVLISSAGGQNIVPEGIGDFPKLDNEFIIATNPDIIILSDAPYGESIETVKARAGWDDLDAVREGRVVPLTQEQVDTLSRPGPRVIEAVLLLAQILHPELLE